MKRLDRIISNFLEAIRPAEPDFKPVDLLALLEEVLRLLEVEFEEKNVKVEVEEQLANRAIEEARTSEKEGDYE